MEYEGIWWYWLREVSTSGIVLLAVVEVMGQVEEEIKYVYWGCSFTKVQMVDMSLGSCCKSSQDRGQVETNLVKYYDLSTLLIWDGVISFHGVWKCREHTPYVNRRHSVREIAHHERWGYLMVLVMGDQVGSWSRLRSRRRLSMFVEVVHSPRFRWSIRVWGPVTLWCQKSWC